MFTKSLSQRNLPSFPENEAGSKLENFLFFKQLIKNNSLDIKQLFKMYFSYKTEVGYNSLIALDRKLSVKGYLDSKFLHIDLFWGDTIFKKDSYLLPDSFEGMYSMCFKKLSDFLQKELFDGPLKEYYLEKKKIPLVGGWQAITQIGAGKTPIFEFVVPNTWIKINNGVALQYAFDTKWFDLSVQKGTACMKGAISPKNIEKLRVSGIEPEFRRYIDKMVKSLKMEISEFDKVVLSKKITLEKKSDWICPYDTLQCLIENGYESYDVYYEASEREKWLCISPETLVRQKKRKIEFEPLAGTRNLSSNESQNELFKSDLLSDPKEESEHSKVIDQLLSTIKEVVREDSIELLENKKVQNFGYVQHLKSTIHADLLPSYNTFDVLAKIYPPATIWGLPIESAANEIVGFEPFAREYFSGGLGFVDGEGEGEFALAIRCAKISGNQMSVYAGSGIVKGSDPYKEWVETTNKAKPFLDLTHKGESC